jgi:uncharacterized protein
MIGKAMKRRVEMDYPCWWGYATVGPDEGQMRKALEAVLKEREYTLNLAKVSSKGKYCSIRVKVLVNSQEERICLYNQMASLEGIKIVL